MHTEMGVNALCLFFFQNRKGRLFQYAQRRKFAAHKTQWPPIHCGSTIWPSVVSTRVSLPIVLNLAQKVHSARKHAVAYVGS